MRHSALPQRSDARFASTVGVVAETRQLPVRCLWLARYLPYPLDAGAKVYSAKLAGSLAAVGVYVRFAGFGDRAAASAADSSIDWAAVPGTRRSAMAALWSALPVAAAIDATGSYHRLLEQELLQRWDVIVFDGYGSGWALPRCLVKASKEPSGNPLILVHVSHNHEARLWTEMTRDARSSTIRRLALRRNSGRIRTLESSLVKRADLVTAITDDDRLAFATERSADQPVVTLSPGYTGWIAPERRITAAIPRHVLLMGSFNWVVKRENLLRFLEIADPAFQLANITLDVLGDVPRELLTSLEPRCSATRFHGFVEEVAPYFRNARLAVVPELIGGGFKLKFLDYFFGRVPVATISDAAAGLAPRLRETTLQCLDLKSLVATIVAHIDETELLDDMQQRAFAHAQGAFQWAERGRNLLAAIEQVRRDFRPLRERQDLHADAISGGD